MSLLIKNMEMPKDKAIAVVIHPDGTAYSAEMLAGVCTKYLTDCEAIPVPPHGDLVDRDAIRKDWLENYRYALTSSILDSLDSADTIIPAEEAKSKE